MENELFGFIAANGKYCRKLSGQSDDTVLYITDVRSMDIHTGLSWLTSERKSRLDAYRRTEDKRLLLGAELAYIYGFCDYLGTGLQNVGEVYLTKRDRSDLGKPYLPDRSNVHFSLSHSGNYAICAFSDVPVGIDIEQMSEEYMDIATHFFTDAEKKELMLLDGDVRKRRFFEYWVMKESYLKATGKGMSVALDSFSIEMSEGTGRVSDKNSTEEYQIRILGNIDEEYSAALCRKVK